VEPILLPVSLFYLIYSSPKTLLVLQTIAIAIGAWPLYLLAREKLQSEFGGIVFAAAYLLSPALEAANLFQFHAVSLAPTFLLWAFYFLEKEKALWFIVFSVLAMSCKEEMPLLIVMMGLYAFFLRKRKKLGMVMIVVAVIWFYVAVYIIVPWANPQGRSQYLAYYKDWGNDPLEIALAIIRQRAWWLIFNKVSFDYLFRLLLPLAFLPLFYLPILLIALPSLAINVLSSSAEQQNVNVQPRGVPLRRSYCSFRRPSCHLGGRIPDTAPGEAGARGRQIVVLFSHLFGFGLQPGLSSLSRLLSTIGSVSVACGHRAPSPDTKVHRHDTPNCFSLSSVESQSTPESAGGSSPLPV